MTDQLRSLLEQAVPDDAPTLDPVAVAVAARHSRRRSRIALAGATALVLLGGAGAVAVLDGRGADGDRVTGRDTSAPYDAPACPSMLPELTDASTSVGSLEGLTSVRLCPDLAPAGLITPLPTPSEQKAILASMDALVDDLPGFANQVAKIEPFDAGRCAALDVFNNRQSLQLTYAGGRTVVVPTATCVPVRVAGKDVDGQYLGEAYLTALDRQRDALSYHRSKESAVSCDRWLVPNPARPGRERIVSAVFCDVRGSNEHPDITAQPLTHGQVREVDAAWQRPIAVPPDPTAVDDESDCTAPQSRPSYLLAVTDRGDVVHLNESGCGYLLLPNVRRDALGAIPITLADLGITP